MSFLTWGCLLLFAGLPFPLPLFWSDPALVWPLIWFVATGLLAFLGDGGRLPWPLVAGFGYLCWRVWQGGFLPRSLELLAVVALALALYRAAMAVPAWSEPWLAGVALIPAGGNALLGLWNLTASLSPQWRILDPTSMLPPLWRQWLSADLYGQDGPWIGPLYFVHPAYWWRTVEESYFGQPHGLFVHPNYWALYLALCLPLVWWASGQMGSCRRVQVAAVWGWVAMIGTARSWVATGAAALAAWLLCRFWRPRARAAGMLAICILGLGAGWVALRGLAPFPLGGRLPVWQIALEWVWPRHPWIGEGWGLWRVWALWEQGPIWQGSPAHHFPPQDRMAGWWAEAQGEPVQLVFELGLIGLGLALWWAITVGRDGWRVWSAGEPLGRAWVVILLTGAVTSLGTIPFRLPATVALILFAAGRVRARAHESRDPHLLGRGWRGGAPRGGPRIRV